MFKTIILLTKSRKKGGYCTSGIDINTGEWIRIVSDGVGCHSDEIKGNQLTYNTDEEAEILDVITINYIKHEPIYYQPENYINDNNKFWQKIGQANINEIAQLHPFENKEYVYFDTNYKVTADFIKGLDNKYKYSLILIKVTNLVVRISLKPWDQEKSVSIDFRYNNKDYRYFRITDDDFALKYYDYTVGNYTLFGCYSLVISLGEPFAFGNDALNHYKLIAKVFKL